MPANVIVILFALGALVGLFMAAMHFRGRTVPLTIPTLHGLFVGAGLISLIIYLLEREDTENGGWVLVAFLLAAAGGAYLLSRHLRHERWPSAVVLAHGGIALAAFVVLVLWLS